VDIAAAFAFGCLGLASLLLPFSLCFGMPGSHCLCFGMPGSHCRRSHTIVTTSKSMQRAMRAAAESRGIKGVIQEAVAIELWTWWRQG